MQVYGFGWLVTKESTALFNEIAQKLRLKTLNKLHCLPSINAVNIMKLLLQPRHVDWASPFLW